MSSSLSAAQTRIIEAALRVFTRNGVGGTSLQMIADEIGVTKAAVTTSTGPRRRSRRAVRKLRIRSR